MRVRPLIGAIALCASSTGSACAAVAVIADTSAANCSRAALEKRADDASLRSCNQAIEQGALNRADLTRTYVNRGAVLMNRHDYDAARADLERAIQLDPSVGDAWMNRGAIAIIEHRYADGIADTTKGAGARRFGAGQGLLQPRGRRRRGRRREVGLPRLPAGPGAEARLGSAEARADAVHRDPSVARSAAEWRSERGKWRGALHSAT